MGYAAVSIIFGIPKAFKVLNLIQDSHFGNDLELKKKIFTVHTKILNFFHQQHLRVIILQIPMRIVYT